MKKYTVKSKRKRITQLIEDARWVIMVKDAVSQVENDNNSIIQTKPNQLCEILLILFGGMA